MKKSLIVLLLCLSNLVSNAQCPAAPVQEICLIGADTLTYTHNVITWEKPADVSGLGGFIIYKYVAFSYLFLDSVSVDSLSEYHDYSSDPDMASYTYAMATFDTCGNVSPIGNRHTTLFLHSMGDGTFYWNLYQIQNNINPIQYYELMRDDYSTGNWHTIAMTAGTQTVLNDIDYTLYPQASHRVVAYLSYTCNPTRNAVNTVSSNVIDRNFIGIGGINPNAVKSRIYPNPFINEVTFEISLAAENATLMIYNNLGQLVFETKFKGTKFVLNTESIAEGIYSYKLSSNLRTETGTLIKMNK